MTIRNVLIHVDNGSACRARVAAALALTRGIPVNITGFYCPRYLSPLLLPYGNGSQTVYHLEAETIQAEQRSAEELFHEVTKPSGRHCDWVVSDGALYESLTNLARLNDLVVVGSGDPFDDQCTGSGLAEHLALAAGSPVLVVPPSGNGTSTGERLVVAWNGSREGSRAVKDALPLLHVAKEVHLVSVGDGADSLDGLSHFLYSHGIVTTSHLVPPSSASVEAQLLGEVARLKGDIVVLGAYGHSRLREFVLGGVTRAMFRQAMVPVLVSH